jgi:hypothetical protein
MIHWGVAGDRMKRFVEGTDRLIKQAARQGTSFHSKFWPGCSLAAYRAREWDRSEQCFVQCLKVMPTDGPAIVFRRRQTVNSGGLRGYSYRPVYALSVKLQ